MKDEDRRSSAIEVVDLVYGGMSNEAKRSNTRFKDTMQRALSLAIRSGMTFGQGDFHWLSTNVGGCHWLHPYGEAAEGFYREACEAGNSSACRSFETWKGREAFVFGGTRLYIGSRFPWLGKVCKVTSFLADGRSLIACSYKPIGDGKGGYGSEHTVEQRIKVQVEDLRRVERGNKKANAMSRELATLLRALERCRVKFNETVVRSWDPARRKEALAWLELGRYRGLPQPLFISQEGDN